MVHNHILNSETVLGFMSYKRFWSQKKPIRVKRSLASLESVHVTLLPVWENAFKKTLYLSVNGYAKHGVVLSFHEGFTDW